MRELVPIGISGHNTISSAPLLRVSSVSVLMPCRNAGQFLEPAVRSVLNQAECLELLVADGGSTDGSLQFLQELAVVNPRLRIVSTSDCGPADALNKALKAARGTLIGWLNADDLYSPGALARATNALDANPQWMMLYGEGEEFNSSSGLRQRYPTLPPTTGIKGFRSHCFICQPSVVFRRTMGLMLGSFDVHLKTAFDLDYWLRAFENFPHRIGYIPHLQGRTRLHKNTITQKQRSHADLELIKLIAKHFGSAPTTRLHNLGLDLQLGLAETKAGQTQTALLRELAEEAAPWLNPKELEAFRQDWHLNNDQLVTHPEANQTSQGTTVETQSLALQLLEALHPQLHPNAPGSPLEREIRCKQFIAIHKQNYRLLNTDLESKPKKKVPPRSQHFKSNRPFGVNLIGHAYEMFGIGEDIRMAARALQAADVPCCVIHHPAGNDAACIDRSLEPLVCNDPNGGPYAFNLICMQAPIYARWLLKQGLDGIDQRYTIAAWPWETSQWPEPWKPLLGVTDEVWPSSTFTAQALKAPAAQAGIPLHVMHMAAEIPEPNRFYCASNRLYTRNNLGLSSDAIVFFYSFDLNSTTIRKNPMAVLETFQQAFPLPHLLSSKGRSDNTHPLSEHVELLIKTFPPRNFNPEWNWLQIRAQEDPRIHLLEANLERDELLAIFGCSDVFLSLHRSEGFGRGLAEAFQLGLDVISTDYGGNADFCVGPLAHPVRCLEVPIPRNSYPYADGHCWGEPDLNHAAQLMQEVAERRLEIASNHNAYYPSRDARVLADYQKRFSFIEAGTRYHERLKSIWNN